ncbi:MFS transporter [Acidisoma cellulosilytica]|uniref:MFS transporter n=1 Tax=Acidisoma cellulosilyticum TaxID=2802395 RepID=A0A963Z011_9PROT|nr:MFS transporter [Acidisoma cellulosilyticum]MCB8880288.1 MFS transporter [Acidisoma cellulosilyticum]
MSSTASTRETRAIPPEGIVMAVLLAVSFSHFLNDTMQSLLPAIYPNLKEQFQLNFVQIGLLTFVFQVTASLLQPLVGMATDKRPQPYSLSVGMGFTMIGLILLSRANSYPFLLVAAGMIGIGSSIFHPESSRVARLSSGGRHGLAQSVFQVGGNFGTALGPVLAAFIVVPHGQRSIVWFSGIALLGMVVLGAVGRWYQQRMASNRRRPRAQMHPHEALPQARVLITMIILVALVFSKFFYLASISSYYTFYLIHQFNVSVQSAQLLLFVFLGAAALGTVFGGPIGDKIGRKLVIWVSILGILPFTLALPYVGLGWTVVLSFIIGFVLSSAMPAMIVYAQELVPGRVGLISGLFFGLAFGMGGLGAAAIGIIADRFGIVTTYEICSFLPVIGLLAAFLPHIRAPQHG